MGAPPALAVHNVKKPAPGSTVFTKGTATVLIGQSVYRSADFFTLCRPVGARTHPSFNASFQASLPPRLWDPASQLRFERKRSVPPRPDGAPNTGQG
ncbi:MAG TPA: hypothetical protein VMU39_23200, partial [Solirubrobacteraceae bacterium]|nr:hypothetical protein [Solirubrobacteraceae bacterium]